MANCLFSTELCSVDRLSTWAGQWNG